MKKAAKTYTEKLKQNMEEASERSKQSIRSIIDSSSRQIESALEANKKYIDSLESEFSIKNNAAAFVSEVKKAFNHSVELSEEAIDAIIDIHSAQLRSALAMNSLLMEAINDLDLSREESKEELLRVIEKNLTESSGQSIENTKKITDIYNRHINLALHFNERMARNINAHLQLLNKFQPPNADVLSNWISQWWKSASTEEVAA